MFSFTYILSGLFVVYIFHSMWTIYNVFNPSQCYDKADSCLEPAWQEKDVFQIFICTSTDDHPLAKKLNCIWQDSEFKLSNERKIPLNINLPNLTLRNGSLYLHVVLTSLRNVREPTPYVIEHELTYVSSSPLTKYSLKQDEVFNLLNKKKSIGKNLNRPVTHWKPKIIVNIVSKPLSLSKKALPGEIVHLLKLDSRRKYIPIVYVSDVRQRVKDLWPVNQSNPVMPLELSYEPTSIGKLRFIVIIETSLKSISNLGFTEYDIDDVKGIFFDTNLYLLLLTVFVTSFHVLFDFLAFKNDIQFWRQRKSMEGLSFSTLLWRCVSQFIITLYLFDQKTSLLVLIPSGISTIIELWKLKKALKIDIKGFKFTKSNRTSAEIETDSYDSKFMKFLSLYILSPLVIGGAIYSVLYTKHKSWHSWLIQSLANGVYAFGFLFMLPQLFINYKLKSVAHLPWRAFMYKAFNTFIDDLFAFLLTSIPTSHRVAAFRDDVVFIIYLYQRWLYPVDKTRANEYGEVSEEKKTK